MKRYFSERLVLVSKGATTEDIKGKVVETATVRTYMRISIENLDNPMTELRVGVDAGGIFHPHEEEDTPAAATLYWSTDELRVFEDDRLQVLITGATTGDRIRVYTQGYDEVNDA